MNASDDFEEGLAIRDEISDLSAEFAECLEKLRALKVKHAADEAIMGELKRVGFEVTEGIEDE